MQQIVYMGIFAVSLLLLSRTILLLFFKLENHKLNKERLRQLNFEDNKDNDEEVRALIDKITQPIVQNVFPRFDIGDLEGLQRDLKLVGWDTKFTPIQYLALIYLGRALGIIIGLLLLSTSKFMAILWGAVLFLVPNLLLKNAANNKRSKILMEFPDFIRVAQGYLSAGFPLTRAARESIRYVGEDWQKILEKFVVTAEISGIEAALDGLAVDADIYEAREFVSLIHLTLEQGGNAKEGFSQQANRIQEMLYDSMMKKVGEREIYGIIVQGPLLLCNIIVFGLPTFSNMMNIGG